MEKAIFFYNEDLLLVPNYENKTFIRNPNAENLLFRLKELELFGFKIIHILSIEDPIQRNHNYGMRILNFTKPNSSQLHSLKVNEVYSLIPKDYDTKSIISFINQVSEIYNINLNKSWIVGNTLNEVEAGNRLGLYSIILDNGIEDEWFFGPQRTPNCYVKDLNGAINEIKIQSVAST